MMRHSFVLALCSCLVLAASAAAPPETEVIKAGPFSVTAPKTFAAGFVVEKVAINPLYTAEEWKSAKANPMLVMKPAYEIRPQHWAIRFPKLAPKWYDYEPKDAGDYATAPQILIHKADEWDAAFQDGQVDAADAKRFTDDHRKKLAQWLKGPVERISPGYMDAKLSFDCLKKRIRFQGGFGVRAVVQWTVEAELVRRGSLHYLFLGLSDDNTCQIIATFPLDVPGLPDDKPEAKHLGYTEKEYKRLTKEFTIYEAAAKKWLVKRADNFTPSLESLDSMMASLVVKKWE